MSLNLTIYDTKSFFKGKWEISWYNMKKNDMNRWSCSLVVLCVTLQTDLASWVFDLSFGETQVSYCWCWRVHIKGLLIVSPLHSQPQGDKMSWRWRWVHLHSRWSSFKNRFFFFELTHKIRFDFSKDHPLTGPWAYSAPHPSHSCFLNKSLSNSSSWCNLNVISLLFYRDYKV